MIGVTMADVLTEHQPTSKLLSPSDVRMACLCGRFAQDHELPTYHNAWIIRHQSDALAAAGFGHIGAALDDKAEQEDS